MFFVNQCKIPRCSFAAPFLDIWNPELQSKKVLGWFLGILDTKTSSTSAVASSCLKNIYIWDPFWFSDPFERRCLVIKLLAHGCTNLENQNYRAHIIKPSELLAAVVWCHFSYPRVKVYYIIIILMTKETELKPGDVNEDLIIGQYTLEIHDYNIKLTKFTVKLWLLMLMSLNPGQGINWKVLTIL